MVTPPTPDGLVLTARQLDDIFPFHVGFDGNGLVTHLGRSFRRLQPGASVGMPLHDLFARGGPDASMDIDTLRATSGELCTFREKQSGVVLRGQIQALGCAWFFIGSPWFHDLAELTATKLTLADYAAHDPTLDLLQLLQLQKVAAEDLQRLATRLSVQSEELRAKEREARKLALVADSSDNAVIITDPQGRIEWVNEGFTRITGYVLAESRGRRPAEFLQGPQTDPATVAFMRERLARREGFTTEVLNYRKNGRPYWLAIEVQPIRDGDGNLINFMAIESDITDRRQAQENLRIQLDVAQALGQSSNQADAAAAILKVIGERMKWTVGFFWQVDEPSARLRCAASWHDPAVAAAAFIAGVRGREFAPGQGLPGRAWSAGQYIWAEDAPELPTFRPGGDARAAGLHCAVAVPIIAEHHVLGAIEFFSHQLEEPNEARLNTLVAACRQFGQFLERMRVQDALRRQAADLLRANAELAQAARMKSVFLASMSHELRTPLTAILGMSETLIEQDYGPLNERQLRYVRIVETSGRQLLALINDLLELAKIEAGLQELNRSTCTVDELCATSVTAARALAAKRGQTFTFACDAGAVRLNVDVERLAKVLTHLLGNAAKFSPDGGEFGLRVTPTGQAIKLCVWDRGIGIAPADLARLFQPFVQLDARLARKYDGTGLGLALVKHWVEMHGGIVSAASEVGVGSEFTALIPLDAGAAHA